MLPKSGSATVEKIIALHSDCCIVGDEVTLLYDQRQPKMCQGRQMAPLTDAGDKLVTPSRPLLDGYIGKASRLGG